MRTVSWYAIQHGTVDRTVPMETCRWLDTQTGRARFTVRARMNGKWAHIADGDELRFFDNEEAASAEITRLRAAGGPRQ